VFRVDLAVYYFIFSRVFNLAVVRVEVNAHQDLLVCVFVDWHNVIDDIFFVCHFSELIMLAVKRIVIIRIISSMTQPST